MDGLILVDWMQRLALASTTLAFAEAVEQLFRDEYSIDSAEFWQLNSGLEGPILERPSQQLIQPLQESDGLGRFVLNCEPIIQAYGADHVDWIFPVKLYGKVVGAVSLRFPVAESQAIASTLPEDLAVWQDFLGLQLAQLRERAGGNFLRKQSDQFVQRALQLLQGPEHLSAVAQVVQDLGSLLTLPIQTRRVLQTAALYHDVGLIVAKQSGEWILRSGISSGSEAIDHASLGADYLLEYPDFGEVSVLVRFHHERFDGSGALGRQANELPIECWVLALAEDLIEHREREVSKQQSKDEWIRSFFDQCGHRHHPAVVDALGGLLVSGRLG